LSEQPWDRHAWSRLNHLQLGRYAEYYIKMEFTLYGFDVYTSEVDDKGIDFIVRKDDNSHLDIQVKSARNLNYIFLPKDKFKLRPNLFAAVVLFNESKPPEPYLIPSLTWQQPNSLFTGPDYEGKKSKPEWGLSFSRKNIKLLEEYQFDKVIQKFMIPQETNLP